MRLPRRLVVRQRLAAAQRAFLRPELVLPDGRPEPRGERERYGPAVRGTRADFFAVDVTRGLPLPDESVDAVFHEDFIEHLTQEQTVGFLAETFRVLKPGGVHRINTPDLVTSMTAHSDFRRGLLGVYREEWSRHEHHHVLTAAYLEELARLVGYAEVHLRRRNESAAKDVPTEYRPDPDDRPEDGNIFADLIR